MAIQQKVNAELRELALFAGAGGGILGGKLLGWRTICAVEWDAYAASVLVARQNDGCLEPFPIWDDVQSFDGKPWRGRVDVVSGGFPCTDISCAGKGAGIDGEASGMWRHMARIVGEVRPRFVFVENSPMLVVRGLDRVLGDLTALGYDARWGIVGAVHAGAPHRRDRIWIVASDSALNAWNEWRAESARFKRKAGPSDGCNDMADADSIASEIGRNDLADAGIGGLREGDQTGSGVNDRRIANPAKDANVADAWSERGQLSSRRQLATIKKPWSDCSQGGAGSIAREWWATEPDLGRVAYGVAARVDRLRCIGNGQVPAVVRLAWSLLAPTT